MNLPVWLQLLPYDELNAWLSDPAFCAQLGKSMDDLWAGAEVVEPGAQLLSGDKWAGLRNSARYTVWRVDWEELWQ